MAVANSIGSNVFDILIGLALPWFLQTCLLHPGSTVITYGIICIVPKKSLFGIVRCICAHY